MSLRRDDIVTCLAGLIVLVCCDLVKASNEPASIEKKEGVNKLIQVYLAGEVVTPSTIKLPRKSTIIELVEKAGGFTQLAGLNRVVLYRGRKIWVYDLRKDEYKKVKLEPYDLVFVPRKVFLGKEKGRGNSNTQPIR